jgi:hypothetical protein
MLHVEQADGSVQRTVAEHQEAGLSLENRALRGLAAHQNIVVPIFIEIT